MTDTKWQEEMLVLAKRNRWIVVAVTGATNSGKTTLVSQLEHTFQPSVVLHQDHYFRSEGDPNHVWVTKGLRKPHQNWECLQSVDWNALCDRIRTVLSSESIAKQPKKGFLFLDGHIILNYKPIAQICDIKFFIELGKSTIQMRRVQRNYIPPDPQGYFDHWVWPMYLENKAQLKSDHIIFIDGSQSIDYIFKLMSNILKNYK